MTINNKNTSNSVADNGAKESLTSDISEVQGTVIHSQSRFPRNGMYKTLLSNSIFGSSQSYYRRSIR